MRISEILTGETPVFSFEFFPPKTEAGEQNLYRALQELKALEPSFVSVTYGAGGSSRSKTIEIVKRIKEEFGLEAMAHFTCVGATVPELRATLDEMQAAGIENVLALRGDPPEGEDAWTKTEGGLEYSRELVALIGGDYEFAIGAACFPETHIHAESAESDLRYLAEKVDAGVDFLITQMFFDNNFYFDFVARARRAGLTVPIIPGIMPITRVGQLERMASMCGSAIPDGLRAELHGRESDAEAVLDFGVAYATLQCSELLAAGAPGVHFYTLNRSPATRAIVSALKLARPWERAIYPASISSPSATRGEPSGAS
ncbi:MAG: methylenetetrahydrofolate reductase [Solirubrobacteraceae bacterium]|jgi:methylenetetrahydrofolate reductase (NADPH)|nr:methylenetetrahydrofolate reductase [Solirubrobacteraceae bacterium]MEA2335100.1 methylenetetrahydrofolate reductase [Solirubrobacteraceae bacterium]